MDGPSQTQRKIIIAIDFGTTYSGVAWAQTRAPGKILSIDKWPTMPQIIEGRVSQKVPTTLSQSDGELRWGFMTDEIEDQSQVNRWFKLGLNGQFPAGAIGTPVTPAEAESLLILYMRVLNNHIQHTLYKGLSEAFVRNVPLEFVLTVPAIWSDAARERTRRACQMSLTMARDAPIHMISEPEAAALYVFYALDPLGLKVGESFMVVDAGGGTVDLITYTIERLEPSLMLREECPGSGGLCGSSYINQEFERYIIDKLHQSPGWDKGILEDIKKEFEDNLKRTFNPFSGKTHYSLCVAGLPDNPALGIRRRRYNIPVDDMCRIYDVSVLKATRLVQAQISSCASPIKAILLVGGFGQSVYLEKSIANTVGKHIQVLRPDGSWDAVAQGAVLRGLAINSSGPGEITIRSRKSRLYYGVEIYIDYNPAIHTRLEQTPRWSTYDGCMKVDIISWHLHRGDTVTEDQPSKVYFHQVMPQTIQDLSLGVEILMSASDGDAPMERSAATPVHSVLSIDFSEIPKSSLTARQGQDGLMYWELNGHVEITYRSADIQYKLFYMDVLYNTVTADYLA